MCESRHDHPPKFAAYILKKAHWKSPDWIVSGSDSDGFATKIFTVNSEGYARGILYKITGDVGWLTFSGKKECRDTHETTVRKTLLKEVDNACENITTARQGIENSPDDLEWPSIEEGSIDCLRALMRIAEAAGLDVSKYETIITGDNPPVEQPNIDKATGLQIGP